MLIYKNKEIFNTMSMHMTKQNKNYFKHAACVLGIESKKSNCRHYFSFFSIEMRLLSEVNSSQFKSRVFFKYCARKSKLYRT